ncbi:MAG: four helix bundle protein [Mizugakiibacter sp.]|uniref:four helix bundle protein n=1 Tax=Mizugakiibacter sp. TaxID=1972610 RepID=UPI00320E21B8
MAFDLPPIAKAAERLLVEIEQAVRAFPRCHKYVIGKDLREQAMLVVRLCHRAWRDRSQQARWTAELVWAIDELRLTVQLGSRIKAFRSFAQFEQLIRLVEDLGRQAGGWKRQQQQHLKGQNPAREAAPERAQILSTCAASTGANA